MKEKDKIPDLPPEFKPIEKLRDDVPQRDFGVSI